MDNKLSKLTTELKTPQVDKGKLKAKGKSEEKVEDFAKTLKEEALKKEEKAAKAEDGRKKERKDGREDKREDEERAPQADRFRGDLLRLMMYRLAYTDPSLINISLRQSLGIDKLSKANVRAAEDNLKSLMRGAVQSQELKLTKDTTRKDKVGAPMGDPLAALRGLHTTLKEITAKEGVKESQIIRQLVEKLNVRKLSEGHEVNVILNPNVLGQVAVQILTEGNSVIAIFKTTSSLTYRELNEEKEELIRSLRERGLKVTKVRVEYVENLK